MLPDATKRDLPTRWQRAIQSYDPARVGGRIVSSRGLMLTCRLPAAVHDRCEILTGNGNSCLAEVVGFANDLAYLFLYENGDQVRPHMRVINRGHGVQVPSGPGLLGRSIDGIGRPIDGRGVLSNCRFRTQHMAAPSPLQRTRIRDVFTTNLRAVDGLLTCGRGQRMGIFAGSGVGKSTLLGQIAKASDAEVNVIALIGERGSEVRPFIEDCLGEGLRKSVVVVATSDDTPLMRVRAALLALAIADSFRHQGNQVLLMVDSLTRLAMAQRQIGIAHGEPPTARGYTPSVFQLLANYVECMGNAAHGSITGMLTVLVDGDDFDEPITDAVRSFVDGHIVLDRRLAEIGHFPAISVGKSISRVMDDVTDATHQDSARKIRAILGTYAQAEDLIRIGAYVRGSSPSIDKAIELREALRPGCGKEKPNAANSPETGGYAANRLGVELLIMKRQQFRLGSVMRYYELQKQRTELELQRACRILQETDLEIARLNDEIAALAEVFQGGAAATFSVDGWIARFRKSEQVGKSLAATCARRIREAEVVAGLQETRKKWSIAEEALLSNKREIETFNHAEDDKAQQEILDETVLRKWLNKDPDTILET